MLLDSFFLPCSLDNVSFKSMLVEQFPDFIFQWPKVSRLNQWLIQDFLLGDNFPKTHEIKKNVVRMGMGVAWSPPESATENRFKYCF